MQTMPTTRLIIALALAVIVSTYATARDTAQRLDIAFLADIHLHDPYQAARDLPANNLPKDPVTGEPLLLRSMNAQFHSTRLFNENYWVLRAALDDIVARGIKLVALPGDFSDDGQPVNIRALNTLLNEYAENYGIRFYAMNGNHDPTRPFTRAGGKTDFLAADGHELSVVSEDHPACLNKQAWQCNDNLKEWGYAEIVSTLSAHGFMPHSNDLLFETPFNTTNMAKRYWQWCDEEEKATCIRMPDTSYLVEPVKDVWLLAIDANVYSPAGKLTDNTFNGSGNAGYNALIHYKPDLIRWITDVARRAKLRNKKLIAFSHFPMADFYDDSAPALAELFGDKAMQLGRLPTRDTTETLASTGIKLHFAGHMHLFDTSKSATSGLVNVQVPSLAAYQPGYTILSITPGANAHINTVILADVPGFDRWFNLYKPEWQYRQQTTNSNWSLTALNANNYLAFTDAHLQHVIRHRYLPREWPAELAKVISNNSVGDLLSNTGCKAMADSLTLTFSDVTGANAMLLVDDYYRVRNAGAFASLQGRGEFYQRLAQHLDSPDCVESLPTTPGLSQFLHLVTSSVKDARYDQPSFEFQF
ncbi:metallophosphoesterase [Alteromonas gilva]|uniref:Metallophosphoesterase n=1 Tax=Alteromonas gilva TaxID=2987522 RepID=A0ABT5L1Q7_9ALTE|nr:metallophosphoesterase [Alteromonas gilva]MDC8830807.1 metallophosphoesterase [Alteromonas gilva]